MKNTLRMLGAVLVTCTLPILAWAEGQTHYLAIHVDQNDPQVMNIVLNNAQNVDAYYKAQGDKVVIEVVAHGPGLTMYIPGESPVEQRIAAMSLELEDITFSACGNTLKGMEKKAGHKIDLISEARVVPAGIVRLMELQAQGYAYVRP